MPPGPRRGRRGALRAPAAWGRPGAGHFVRRARGAYFAAPGAGGGRELPSPAPGRSPLVPGSVRHAPSRGGTRCSTGLVATCVAGGQAIPPGRGAPRRGPASGSLVQPARRALVGGRRPGRRPLPLAGMQRATAPVPCAPGRQAAPPRRSRPPGGRGAPGGAGCPCARRVRWRAAVTGGGCPAAAGSRGGRGPGGRVPALAVTAAGPGLVGRAGARWRVRWWCGCRGRGVRVPGRPGWRGWVRRGRGSRTSGAGPR
ncbi:hypothetical protein FBY34_8676 [Streptomyces sp. SLBN-115]|nr:hypothetical protein FBY34_8676 [Streptomyces sp. SLBN-115]